MPEKNKGNAKLQIIFSAILLGLIFNVQLYSMINIPQQFVVIGLLGVLLLLALYVLVRSIIAEGNIRQEQREEQYESIVKAEKASYLLQKKYFEEIEDRLDFIEESSKIPMQEIVGTQKGIGKAIINRSRENAEAVISSNDQIMERMDDVGKMIEDNREQLIQTYRDMGEDTLQQIAMKQQEFIVNLKDMELRLNNAIMQSQKVIAASAPVMAAPIMQPTAPQMIPEPVKAPVVEEVVEPEPIPEPVVEEVAEPEPIPEPVVEEVVEPEPIAEEKPPMPDLSDPNKVMSPDDIAALLANMPGDEEPEAETASEPEPIAEEKPPMPDLSDPNKVMSPDDIAALLANMPGDEEPAAETATEPEPIAEEKPPMPDLSDPNKVMSPDDIAALLANMPGDEEPEAETASEPEPIAEEKPPMPDLSDPNKKMSADDIAALFAAMG